MGSHMHSPAEGAPPLRRTGFWILGEVIENESGAFPFGPMWVEALAPVDEPTRIPLVFVHGGGGQGTDWLVTPDGRAGWAVESAVAGHPVYVVDRPGHGRSPHHPDVLGRPGGQLPIHGVIDLFSPADAADRQSQWPGGREPDSPELAQLAASTGFLLRDLATAHELDAARLAALLDRTGPAVVIAHSAGAAGAWVGASRARSVAAIVAVEPIGPPYVEVPGIGALSHGLAAVPLGAHGLGDVPILIVTGEASPIAALGHSVAEFLREQGSRVDELELASAGIRGNGHGLIFERNSNDVLDVVRDWISTATAETPYR